MIDILYVLTTLSFFALMLAYVSFCDRLARQEPATDKAPEARR